MWGATKSSSYRTINGRISIHAPRVGRDIGANITEATTVEISIHAPRVGRDLIHSSDYISEFQFQSTRPVWGATIPDSTWSAWAEISIHAPRVGRDDIHTHTYEMITGISIHAPRVGRDQSELL